MTFLQFLSYADPAALIGLFVTSPLLALKYSGLVGLLVLLTGAVGLGLLRAAFRGTRVHSRRAFLTLAGVALGLGWFGAYFGYVGLLQRLEQVTLRPTDAQLANGAMQAWTTVVWGSGVALAMVAAGKMAANRRAEEPTPLPAS